MILCNRIEEVQHRLEYQQSMPTTFVNGEALRDALPGMEPGARLIYHGVLHGVIDAGKQGNRIKVIYVHGIYREGRPPKNQGAL